MSNPTTENFEGYGKRCMLIFLVVMCITAMMLGVFYSSLWDHASSHYSPALAITLTLAAALVNASLVASYLMHLLSERRMIFIVLLFTAIFFTGLFALTLGARLSVPAGTVH